MNLIKENLRVVVLVSVFSAALICETIWPLRKRTQPKSVRIRRNLGVALVSISLMRLIFLSIEIKAARYSTENKIGLLNYFDLNQTARLLAALILLDYTLYYWHIMNHRIPLLWRFHNAHHTDLDLDASTALRFHFGELAFSSFYRVAQIFLFGVNASTLLLFETCVTCFATFHHSNFRLSEKFEDVVLKFIVAPRMHGIHHSIVREETDSNFGTILTLWDRLHKTLNLKVPQEQITIGVPSYRALSEQSLVGILSMPFKAQRQWRLPDGQVPKRQNKITQHSSS